LLPSLLLLPCWTGLLLMLLLRAPFQLLLVLLLRCLQVVL
jgi:hypothetical protein